jgi:PAS domain S-box-containing protein
VLVIYDLTTGRHTYFSGDAVNVFGYSSGEMANMPDAFAALLHPDDIPRVQGNLERLRRLADGEINEFECRIRRGDGGELRWVNARSMVFARYESGEASQIISAAFDVTERKETERKLLASEQRFRSYFELGLIGMAITSPTKGCLAVNDELCSILGYDHEELLTKNWAEITHPDDLAADLDAFNRVTAGEIDGYRLDKRYIRKDGRIIDTTMSVKCVRRDDGSVDYFVALVEDITARKVDIVERLRAEDALRQANDELEHRVEQRTRQLSDLNEDLRKEIERRERLEADREHLLRRVVSAQEDERRRIAGEMHDQLGQNISSLGLRLSALKKEYADQPELRERFASLRKIVRQLDTDVGLLVRDLRPTALDDFGLVVALTNYVNNWSKQFGIRAALHAGGMKNGRLADEMETVLYRITQEALTNVAKHADAGSVEILLERRASHVSLIVEDDGAGFDVPSALETRGKGFGLINMRERAALVAGTLAIESNPGAGATIAVRIPLQPSTGGANQDG